jgi:hypothetical protein
MLSCVLVWVFIVTFAASNVYSVVQLHQDKRDLLTRFVENSGNMDAIETQLVIARRISSVANRGRECLTVAEMRERKLPESCSYIISTCFVCQYQLC